MEYNEELEDRRSILVIETNGTKTTVLSSRVDTIRDLGTHRVLLIMDAPITTTMEGMDSLRERLGWDVANVRMGLVPDAAP